MWAWLKRNRGKAAPDDTPERVLSLERELQSLRLELQERQASLERIKSELERQRSQAEAVLSERVQSQAVQLLGDLAQPAAQLLTQAYLFEVQGQPVQTRDVLMVAKRLVQGLQDHGLQIEQTIGSTVKFDPNRHELLSTDSQIQPGEPVMVRFVGLSFQGKRLHKAGVSPAGN